MGRKHKPETYTQIKHLVDACNGNWRSVARLLIAVSRVLLTGRFSDNSSTRLNCLNVSHLATGIQHHEKQLNDSGILSEHINAAIDCLTRICKEDESVAARFYIVKDGDNIRCRAHKYLKAYERQITVPLPKDILLSLLLPYCGESFVLNVIAADVRQHYQLFDHNTNVADEIRRLSDSFNDFVENRGREFSYDELFNHLQSDVEVGISTIEAFIEWLVMARVVRQDHFDPKGLFRIGRADGSFISNTILGLYTGIRGLDYLFEGALRANECWPITMIINGGTGTGKSSLALAYAAAWASSGGIVQYVTMEQDIEMLIHMLEDWGLWRKPAFQVFASEATKKDVNDCLSKSQGVFLGGMIGYHLSFRDLKEKFMESIEKPLWPEFAPKLFVIDSVNALRIYPEEELWRADLFEFLEKAKEKDFSTILVIEGTSRYHKVDHFIADTVLELSHSTYHQKEISVSTYRYRSLQITKARQQHTCRGQHLFHIRSGRGIRVYPAPGAILATLKKPERLKEPDKVEVHTFLLRGFNLLGQSHDAVWLREGTCTAIMGEGGTHKSALSRAFSKSVVYEDMLSDKPSRGSSSLLILFGQRFDPTENEFATEVYDFAEHCRCYEVMPRKPSDSGNWSRELVLEFSSGYQTGCNVISEVMEAIEYLRNRHCNLKRAVVDDIDSMEAEHPVLAGDEFFLPCLVQLLQSHGATVFLVNRLPKGMFEKHDRKIESLSQNVIRLLRVHERGIDRVTIYVSKSSTGFHNKDELELLQVQDDSLEIRDSFGLYKDVRKGGELLCIGITFLASAETELQEKYYEEVRKAHESIQSAVHVHILKPGSELHRRSLSSKLSFTSGDVVVVACDNQDLPALVDEGYFEDLTELMTDEDVKKAFGESVSVNNLFSDDGPFLGSIIDHMPKPMSKKEYSKYQLPFYLNPAILVCGKEFRDEVRKNKGDSYTWNDLAELVEKEAGKFKEPMRFFECIGVTSQTYACFFIEVFFSLLKTVPSAKNGCLRICDCLRDNMNVAQMALKTMYRLAGPCSGNEAYLQKHREQKKVESQTVFRRHWYSIFRAEVEKQIQKTMESDLVAMPLPRYMSIMGDWHLCVIRGSASPQIGAQFITEMCSDEGMVERMAKGVGLTPQRRFYNNDFELPISHLPMSTYKEIHKCSIARSSIRCYRTLSILLGTCVESFLRRPPSMVNDESIDHFSRSILGLFPRGQCQCPTYNEG